MKKRFRDLIDDIPYEDIIRIQKDLDSGGTHLRELIQKRMVDMEREKVKICVTCGSSINPYLTDDYVLHFGRHDFKKKATFCGSDCLKYFLVNNEPSIHSKI